MPLAYDQQQLPAPPWETERLVIRPFRSLDLDAAHDLLDQDESVWNALFQT